MPQLAMPAEPPEAAANLPFGTYNLIFKGRTDPMLASAEIVQVGRAPSVMRHTMGSTRFSPGLEVAGIVVLSLGLTVAGYGLLGLSDSSYASKGAATASLGIGAAATGAGVWMLLNGRPEITPGSSVQWAPGGPVSAPTKADRQAAGPADHADGDRGQLQIARYSWNRCALARIHGRNHAPHVLLSMQPRAFALASAVVPFGCALFGCALFGCAAVKMQPSNDAGGTDTAAPVDVAQDAAPQDTTSAVDHPSFDFSSVERPPPAPGKVYAHSDSTLWLLEPISKQVTMVGTFDCVETAAVASMVDIAIDRTGKMTGSAGISFNNDLGGALVSIDPTNAHCTVLTRGPDLVTSLTYVPEGTLVANAEALVGYADDRYVRVDPTTGALTQIGLLNNAASGGVTWVSSGDVVSIMNGGTYLTVKAQGVAASAGGDRIVEVDPKTGALKRIIGPTGSDDVLGLGYWGGIAYGFTLTGTLIQIDLMTGAGTPIPIPGAPTDLAFYGAGTTTVAPIIVE